MSGQGYNHYGKRSAIDESILTGCDAKMLCGEAFPVEVRVGSSGKSDDPGLPICPRCQRIYDAMPGEEEMQKPGDDIDRELLEALRFEVTS